MMYQEFFLRALPFFVICEELNTCETFSKETICNVIVAYVSRKYIFAHLYLVRKTVLLIMFDFDPLCIHP